MSAINVLVVSPDIAIQQLFATFLAQTGTSTFIAETKDEAQFALDRVRFSLAFCSDELDGDGMAKIIRAGRRSISRVPVVVLTRIRHPINILYLLGAGAFDYLLVPPTACDVSRMIWRVLGEPSLGNSVASLTRETRLRRSSVLRDVRHIEMLQ